MVRVDLRLVKDLQTAGQGIYQLLVTYLRVKVFTTAGLSIVARPETIIAIFKMHKKNEENIQKAKNIVEEAESTLKKELDNLGKARSLYVAAKKGMLNMHEKDESNACFDN